MTVDRMEGNLVLGQFMAGPDYPAVERLFADYVEAANEQLLSIVGELDACIQQLGLHLRCPGAATLPAIDDVQIGLGRINFRLRPDKTAPTGMTPGVALPATPVGR